jgi:hypothetical protein
MRETDAERQASPVVSRAVRPEVRRLDRRQFVSIVRFWCDEGGRAGRLVFATSLWPRKAWITRRSAPCARPAGMRAENRIKGGPAR